MRRLLIIAFLMIWSSNLHAQRIVRSSFSTIGSCFTGKFYLVSSSPSSISILHSQDNFNGTTIQTRPFIHLNKLVISKSIDISIHPNPTTDLVYLKTNEAVIHVDVFDVSGKICYQGTGTILSLGYLESGVYTIKITLENDIIHSQKFIINK